ncbi:lysozyme inhibitor LprI family protein [Methylovirgula ligni]
MRRHLIVPSVVLASVFASASCLGQTAAYAPIECAKASAPAEKTICGNYALGQDESRLATLYGLLTSLVAMGQRGDVMDAQQHWIASRNACGTDVQCLAQSYKARIGDLTKQFDALAKRGPF